ncbi:hypothetical protein GCM10010449_84180 [Streptomyces rectiviolaceus]|uniref:Uncharacterized protein n=1 Tax=Streptomyces rectiviolaceus TaxID=332591 RepID=A0ABP6NNE4_9ACTN
MRARHSCGGGATRRARTRTPSHPDIPLEAAVDAAVKAWLLAQLGETTDLTDLESRYTRLGAARPVALEVLRGRLAAFLQSPTTVNVSGVVGVGYAENIKGLERQIALLVAGSDPAPDEPPTGGADETGGDFGILFLQGRSRR